MSALSDGIRFGLLLQLAVGPVCLFVFRTGAEHGWWRGLTAACGVALADAAYIALACLGVTRWIEGGRMQRSLRYVGAAIIAVFAVDVFLSGVGASLLPSFAPSARGFGESSAFLAAVVLTASNPLTILFWAGVFSAKVAAERHGRRELWLFSLGCVAATVVFLALVSAAGALLWRWVPELGLKALNVGVGFALLYYAAKLAWQAPLPCQDGPDPKFVTLDAE